ncbi:ATP-grasp domain-containing protein [Halomonas mongoliensis]|uniref:ATP-grasp domain-containing protein n=1 Tax=Halomonas mongoliensis TaxID=321265 RepID=A0ABU1GIS1_9GAMM|nr:ATP-grasp domain-containing protein [Halomonas mongoliensis]MDR5891915.1 ATP-grasp domain-containing protein [Halomonas mongoliensis]
MKKILFLGAAPAQLPPIYYALEQCYYVVTCDYLPDNPGHRIAHESYPISTTDRDGVLALARSLSIDGIVAYAADSGAPTAAYVAEKLGLPGNPYDAVCTLTRKDRFRTLLQRLGFKVPRSAAFDSLAAARVWSKRLRLPIYVKPVDAAGSRGITILDSLAGLDAAFMNAQCYSRAKMVVVEESIEKVGCQVDSDAFIVDGKLKFWLWADAHFDPSVAPPNPIANSYPSTIDPRCGERAAAQLQEIISHLGMRNGALNVEFLVDADGEVWFLEVAPRNGGDCIPDVIKHATGVDLVKYTVDAALGMGCQTLGNVTPSGYWSNYIIHPPEQGLLTGIWISEALKKRVVNERLWVKPGMPMKSPIGVLILRFRGAREMQGMLEDMHSHIRVEYSKSVVSVE